MDPVLVTSQPVLAEAYRVWQKDRSCALATVVATHGSAPRDPGAMLLVHEDGSVVGSISGGCVESALYESALETLTTGVPRLESYGPDGDLVAPGLTCGGSLSVLVERVDRRQFPELPVVVDQLTAGVPCVLHTTTPESGAMHTVVDGVSGATRLEQDGSIIRRFLPAPRMVIVGSTDFAAEMSVLGARMGYRVTVCDARPVFATPSRLPHAHDVVCGWPSDHVVRERDSGAFDERSVFVVLTHDPKIDVPALVECLDDSRWPVLPFYVGAMGSRTADARRRRELLDTGVTPDQLNRLHSPIGLAIGNRGPAETAIAIAAELIHARSVSAV
jgi:xanthine dehydrogenase accessory factor